METYERGREREREGTMATHNLVFFFIISMLAVFANGHDKEGGLKYGYKDDEPSKWGSLCPEFKACSNGKLQSPLDIVKKNVFANNKLGPLDRKYQHTNATLVKTGTQIGIIWPSNAGHITVDGKEYKLQQSQWHTPSEHTIDGERYAAELHHVHRSDDGNLAVVSALYKIGDADSLHNELSDCFKKLSEETCSADEQSEVPYSLVDSGHLKKSSHKYYRYQGSLTTPPCNENVTWFVLGKVRELSKEQLEELKATLDTEYRYNARSIQQLNGRQIQQYLDSNE